eukprot:268149_1
MEDKYTFDLSSFKNKVNANESECNNNKGFTKCAAMSRLIIALKYYSMLDIHNVEDREFFRNFMDVIYYQVIDDYIHFNNHHTHELETINIHLINGSDCQISSCVFASRHHEIETHQHIPDDIVNFYKQTMDSLHFYLFHCYDVGIRSKQKYETQQEEKKQGGQYFDAAFSRTSKRITQRAHNTNYNTKRFARFSTNKNGKFNIKTQKEEQIENEKTYLDVIYEYLQSTNVKNSQIKKLNQFIKDEEYETETAGYDIDMNEGNIVKCTGLSDCIEKIQHFMQAAKVAAASFSIGLRFYYWNYYKDRKQLDIDEQVVSYNDGKINNYNTHSGYSICDLFIFPRHDSFKQE